MTSNLPKGRVLPRWALALAVAELRQIADNFEHKAKFYEAGIADVENQRDMLHPWHVRAKSYRKVCAALRSRATRLQKGTTRR